MLYKIKFKHRPNTSFYIVLSNHLFMSSVLNKQALLMSHLTNFFSVKENMNRFLSILHEKSRISLRVIDWFITNYSKEHRIAYLCEKTRSDSSNGQGCSGDEAKPFMVHDSYKSQLKAYSKKQFDPFCRHMRINFYYGKDEKIVTTIGQMNFFRWFIENNILKYVKNHIDDIEKEMHIRGQQTRALQKTKTKTASSGTSGTTTNLPSSRRRKRQENTKSLSMHNMNMTLSFH